MLAHLPTTLLSNEFLCHPNSHKKNIWSHFHFPRTIWPSLVSNHLKLTLDHDKSHYPEHSQNQSEVCCIHQVYWDDKCFLYIFRPELAKHPLSNIFLFGKMWMLSYLLNVNIYHNLSWFAKLLGQYLKRRCGQEKKMLYRIQCNGPNTFPESRGKKVVCVSTPGGWG